MNDLYTYSQKTQGLPVEIIELPNGQTGIRLTADILYQHTPIGPVLVPRGFVSDGASIPLFFWRAIGHPFDYDFLYEAILHDYLYRYQDVDRATADRVLYIMLKGKLALKRALSDMGLWSQVKAAIEDAGRWDDFVLAQELTSDDPDFVAMKAALELDVNAEAILAACKLEG